MLTVHHLNNSRSQRILWLLEELDIPYEIKFYQRDSKTMLAPLELKKIHPLGKSPILTDGSPKQLEPIAESGAIMEYILDHYGQGRLCPPKSTPEGRKLNYWMHYAEASAMPPFVMTLIFQQILKQPLPFFVMPIAKEISKGVHKAYINPQIKLHLDFMESELTKHEWFSGNEFSAADIQMSFPVEAARSRKGFGTEYPKLEGFLNRIHARPAYKRALEKGGPFSL